MAKESEIDIPTHIPTTPVWAGGRRTSQSSTYRWISVALLGALVLSISGFLEVLFPYGVRHTEPPRLLITDATFKSGLAKCTSHAIRPVVDYDLARRRLSSLTSRNGPSVVLMNATLIDGDGITHQQRTVVFRDGTISAIHKVDEPSCLMEELHPNSTFHNLAGRFLTPGLVDMHSHVGVRQVPELFASEDVSELNHGSVTPWARAVDGLKPHDMGIPLLISGGITTSLVLTGAKNIISGEDVVIKMKDTHLLSDLLIDTLNHTTERSAPSKPQRYLKMACGENIKWELGKTQRGPNTRQGMSYDVRRVLSRAQTLRLQQDDWCTLANDHKRRGSLSAAYPEDLSLQTLVDVLRGDVRTNAHCYEPEDVHSLYDHADEFDFNITALHHALEAHHVIDLIRSHGSMLATFSDEWGFKKEVFEASAYMLVKAAEAGIPIALTSDHPAKNGQFLMYEGQIGNHFGLDAKLTMASLTGVPANALGLDNRIGYVKPGYDADFVVWDRHPLQLGARPLQVIIDGKTAVNSSAHLWEESARLSSRADRSPPHRVQSMGDSSCTPGLSDFILKGIKRDYLHSDKVAAITDGDSELSIVVLGGKLACVVDKSPKQECDDALAKAHATSAPVIEVANGFLLPGISLVTRSHGLAEILSEGSTSDGVFSGENIESPTHAALGLSFGGEHVDRAHRAGITRLITPPRSSGLLHGISASFRPGADSRFAADAIIDETALHFSIGHDAKSTRFPTISSQLSMVSHLLTEGNATHASYMRAAQGGLPIVIHTGNKDVIASVIDLKRQYPQLQLVIMGGAEASFLAEHLAEADIPVILAPWMCHPWSWDVRDCLPGPPLTEDTPASKLLDSGVKVALGNWDVRDRYVRNSLWEASWIAGPRNATLAVDLVSRNIQEILGLPETDHFVVYSGNPFEFGASVAVVFEQGEISLCWPDVE